MIIVEVAQAHDGSLSMAHAYIDAIANAGANAVKFQTHIAAEESTLSEPWRVKFSRQDNTRYDYWRRMEFSEEHWHGLKQHADERGLMFLSSPFSLAAIDLLKRVGVPAWKVASGEVGNVPLIDAMVETRLPMLISSGMSDFGELDATVARVLAANVPLTIFQCTTAYPCPPEKIGMNMIPMLRDRYDCAVGLSDHSGTIYAGLAAAAIGIEALEVHVTFSREISGPDMPASVTTAELRQLVEGVRFIEAMRASPVDKNLMAAEMIPLRNLFTKSVVVRVPLSAGTVITSEHLIAKKPGTGIPAAKMHEVIGKRLLIDVQADHILQRGDLSEEE
ncbi:MAG: N-acetylneuraminate synthase family protein [Anaerolineae bacterium]|nr:N-acetylneuraminate synthase family protein [Anaerolineae bacterium]